MKKIKMSLSAVLFILSMLVPAMFASADNGGITITGVASADHTFRVYQLFAGDVYEDKISNIIWGCGVDGDALLEALKADGKLGILFSDCRDASHVARVVEENAEDSEFLIRFDDIAGRHLTTPAQTAAAGVADQDSYTYQLTGLADGYYIVVDSGAGVNDANSLYMTRLLNGEAVTIAVKAVYPTVDKGIIEGSTEKGTSASAGDTVTFELTGTIPADLSGYEDYAYIFHDSMSASLSFAEPLNLTVTASKGTASFDYAVSGQNLTVTVNNAKALAGSTVWVRYDALLNTEAEPGIGEENVVYLEYTHDPNTGGHGHTMEHKVYVYDFDFTIYKEDDDHQPLPGAGFTLYKKDAKEKWQKVKSYKGGDTTTFTFEDLGEGDYRLAETKTPKGYNTIEDIGFRITATYNDDGTISGLATDNPDITVNGTSSFSTTIVNKAGAVLPGFGGSGVLIFYLCGALLILAAVFFMKRRKGARVEEEK